MQARNLDTEAQMRDAHNSTRVWCRAVLFVTMRAVRGWVYPRSVLVRMTLSAIEQNVDCKFPPIFD